MQEALFCQALGLSAPWVVERVDLDVTRSIRQPGIYSGVFPLDENANWEKNAVTLKQLHALRERLRSLEKQLKST